MVVIDEFGAVVESPDEELGRVEHVSELVYHSYVVDAAEEGHFETVAEYPDTGGRDVEWVVDSPEEGHWETRGEDGAIVAHFDGELPDTLPKDVATPDLWEHGVYRAYTAEELAERERRRAEAEAAAARGRQMAEATLVLVRRAAPTMADSEALALSALFPEWAVGEPYSAGDVVRHAGGLWRALQDSVGQAQYPPDAFVAGWKRVGEPQGGAFPWSQPLGATDAYKKGDRVTHGGKTWVSTVDSNVWEPGVYGWEEAAA